jgi:phage replication-related protein YjqB (UPF0714/DUF867 family)
VHGCVGFDERVYIGGLHEELKRNIAFALEAIGVEAWLENHNFPALDPENICNRGRSGRGVQLEFTTGVRRLMQYGNLAASIRTAVIGALDRRPAGGSRIRRTRGD